MKKTTMVRFTHLAFAMAMAFAAVSCTFRKAERGSAENPVQLFFIPSIDARVIDSNSKQMKALLEANTPYKYEIHIPQSYLAVVEAFGSERADVAALNTFGYLLANQKYGVEARMITTRYGVSTYRSQIIARKGRFKSVKDLQGKKFAFVDPASLSGYILPVKFLKDKGVKLGETVFAMKHDNVVSMVYQGQVDAGATFYNPPDKNGAGDARYLVKAQYPDVEQKVEILELTSEIPNDPITFRKNLPEEMKKDIVEALLKIVRTPEGQAAFMNLYGVDSAKPATDRDYDGVREMLKAVEANPEDLMKK